MKRRSPAPPSSIEITPEMVEAGGQVIADLYEAGKEGARAAAREVFQVMSALRPSGDD